MACGLLSCVVCYGVWLIMACGYNGLKFLMVCCFSWHEVRYGERFL